MKLFSLFYLIALLTLLSANSVVAQQSQVVFGKNRLQHKTFNWKSISTTNFTIYYYDGGNSIAHNTARFAEEDFAEITGLIGYFPYRKSTLLVYNSISDLQQSNIGLKDKAFTGGTTDLVKSKIEVGFTGNLVQYRKELRTQIASMLINVMMYGGSMREVVENSYLLHLAPWLTQGAASYVGSPWDLEMADAMKDIIDKKGFDPSVLTGEQARLIGHAIFYYISVKYGEEYIANVINLTKVLRNPSHSISYSLGISYEKFLKDCQEFYRQLLNNSNLGNVMSPKALKLRKGNKKEYRYSGLAFNPHEGKLAYTENKKGKYRVMVLDTLRGKKRKVYTGGFKMVDQKIDYKVPIIAWRNKDELSVMAYKKGKPYLLTKNLDTGKKEKKLFNAFDEIISFDYSPIKDEMVICAVDKGHSDIFVYNYKTNKARQVTKDLYDELHPRYIPGTNTIVFSSNRQNDTLRKDFGEYNDITNQYDLFLYDIDDLDRKKPYLTRLTNTKYNELDAVPLSKKKILYKAEVNRNSHLYLLDLDQAHTHQVSNYYKNIKLFDANPNGSVSFVQRAKGKEYIYFEPKLSMDSVYLSYERLPEKEVIIEEKITKAEMLHKLINLKFSNYYFDGDSVKIASSKTENKINPSTAKQLRIAGPYDYKKMFGIDYMTSTLMFDQLRGAGIFAEVNMSELFTNHKLSASIFLMTDLKSSSFRMEYQYLAKRNDLKIVYDKYAIFAYNDAAIQRYNKHTFAVTISHPITPATKVTLTPLLMQTRHTDFDFIRIEKPDEVRNYGGLVAELVVDNTIEHDINQLQGSRMKASIAQYENWGKEKLGYGRLVIDVRHYQRIVRNLTLAARGSYGQFFGASPKKFLMGGMDNWILSKTDNSNGADPLEIREGSFNQDMLFVEYVTSMRGFNYNKLSGPKYITASFEMRWPIARFLTNKPINSNFLRHLQLLAFYDIGTAWKGSNPFSKENDLNTQVVGGSGGAFTATVVNYRNPFLQGVGMGIRSMIGGYYVKFDLGYGIENYNVLGLKGYLTLGYDF